MKVKLLDIGAPTPAGNIYSLEDVQKVIEDPNFISTLMLRKISRVWIEKDALMGEFEYTEDVNKCSPGSLAISSSLRLTEEIHHQLYAVVR